MERSDIMEYIVIASVIALSVLCLIAAGADMENIRH